MRNRIVLARAVCAAVTAAHVSALFAQSGASGGLLQQQRTIDERLATERANAMPIHSLLDWQWGGWIEYYAFHFDDGVQSQRVLQRPATSLWTRLSFDDGAHELFARMKLTYSYFNPGDEYDRQQDWAGPNFDRAWYDVNIGKALRITNPSDPLQLSVRVGRADVRFGTGYVLDQPLDAVQIRGRVYDFAITGLLGKTPGSYPNIDRSAPVASHSARRLFGVQVAYQGWNRHVPFAYALWNDDFTDERPKDALQNYAYDTRYFGFGSRGEFVHNFSYWAEVAFESGRSYGDGDFLHRDSVEAWGLDVGLEYLWDSPHRPRISGEYMFASGDADRVFSPTNAAGGNYGDSRDTSFVGFGYRDTGIAIGVVPSNLHLWRLGGSLTPVPSVEWLRDFEIGTNWFLYHKNHARGAISDSTADQFEGYVGWEMDYYLNWRLSSDLSWTLRWGMFFPGSAFSDRDERSFLFTGLTWSF
jgi:Alginate export